MKRFAALFDSLDQTTKTSQKQRILVDYFREVPPEDASWAIYFLSGEKLSRLVKGSELRGWAAEASRLPLWLVEESYDLVGDLAETCALLVSQKEMLSEELSLEELVLRCLSTFRERDEIARKEFLLQMWSSLGDTERFLFNKILTGGFRVGVSKKLVIKSLSVVLDQPEATIAHRLTGTIVPSSGLFTMLTQESNPEAGIGHPYPFFLAYPLEREPENLGVVSEWFIEWKWDGIRAQIVKRNGEILLWSRGEEAIGESFPEIIEMASHLPDGTVLDGELLAWKNNEPLDFSKLQRRLQRKRVGPKMIAEIPMLFMSYDILEHAGTDIRGKPLSARRAQLEILFENVAEGIPGIALSPTVSCESWEEVQNLRGEARTRKVEGVMLKNACSPYRVGRIKGDWWKWKVDPLSLDMVLTYAQKGHGRRANVFSDYTFGIWKDGELVTAAKAYSGLTDEEMMEVDRFVRQNTVQRFGPVRAVVPELVFEIAFDSVQASTRHRSGIALRFPRMKRLRRDKRAEQADSLEAAQKLL